MSKSEWYQGSITTQANLLHQQKNQVFIVCQQNSN